MVLKEEQLELHTLEATQATFVYELTTQVVDAEEGMGYTTFGIIAANQDGSVVAAYPDVSTNREFVCRIVKKCNQCRVDAMHLEDILIDLIG